MSCKFIVLVVYYCKTISVVVVVSGRNRTNISKQDRADVSEAEASPVILDSSVVPDSSVGKELL